ALHSFAQNHQGSVEGALKPGRSDLGEPVGFGDDEPAQPYVIWLQQGAQEAAREGAEGLAHVLRVLQRAGRGAGQDVEHPGAGVQDHLGVQVLLVSEVLVEGLLGYRSAGGDLVRGRAEIAVPQEHLTGRLDDRLPLAFGPGGCPASTGLTIHEPSWNSLASTERYRTI